MMSLSGSPPSEPLFWSSSFPSFSRSSSPDEILDSLEDFCHRHTDKGSIFSSSRRVKESPPRATSTPCSKRRQSGFAATGEGEPLTGEKARLKRDFEQRFGPHYQSGWRAGHYSIADEELFLVIFLLNRVALTAAISSVSSLF
ncbi:hypothetical protein FQN60_004382, partial [Etheostoma spectabile]